MPCWQVQTVSVVFKADHVDLLEKALTALGWSFRIDRASKKVHIDEGNDWSQIVIDLQAGQAQFRPQFQDKINQLKRAYSMEALKKLAVKNRWQIEKKAPTKGVLVKTRS